MVSGKLFDCLDNSDDKSVVVVLGSEKEDGVAPEGLRPPSSPQEIRRLWMRVIAKAKPVRTCARNTPLHVTAGSCDKTRAKRGWFGGGSGGDDPSKPKTYFEVVAKVIVLLVLSVSFPSLSLHSLFIPLDIVKVPDPCSWVGHQVYNQHPRATDCVQGARVVAHADGA